MQVQRGQPEIDETGLQVELFARHHVPTERKYLPFRVCPRHRDRGTARFGLGLRCELRIELSGDERLFERYPLDLAAGRARNGRDRDDVAYLETHLRSDCMSKRADYRHE